MIAGREHGSFCDDRTWRSPLKYGDVPIGLVSDKMDCTGLHQMQPCDRVTLIEYVLSDSKGGFASREFEKMVDKGIGHDSDHVAVNESGQEWRAST